MKNIFIGSDSHIELRANDGVSVEDALRESIELCRQEGWNDCSLVYNGFTFDIEPHNRVIDKVKEYNDWLLYKAKSSAGKELESNPISNVNYRFSGEIIMTGRIR